MVVGVRSSGVIDEGSLHPVLLDFDFSFILYSFVSSKERILFALGQTLECVFICQFDLTDDALETLAPFNCFRQARFTWELFMLFDLPIEFLKASNV